MTVPAHLLSAAAALESVLEEMHPEHVWTVTVRPDAELPPARVAGPVDRCQDRIARARQMLSAGMTQRQIAAELGVSTSTVNRDVNDSYRKGRVMPEDH